MRKRFKGPQMWGVILILVMVVGVIGVIVRWFAPFEERTAEQFPWGISAALNMFCGLSVAAGAFSVAATLWASRIETYKPILRASLLIGYAGFLTAFVSACLQHKFRWHILSALWSPRSIPAGALVAFAIYTVALAAEFLPISIFTKRYRRAHEWIRYTGMLVTCVAAVLAARQQVSFVELLRVAPASFSPMWVTPMLPVHLYFSALCVSVALIIFAYWRVTMATGKAIARECFDGLSKAFLVLLLVTLGARVLDITDTGQWRNLLHNHLYDYLFGLEVVLYLAPVLFLLNRHRSDYVLVYDCSVLVIAGFLVNRLNTLITSREVIVGYAFVARASDMAVAVAIIAAAIAMFSWLSKRLPVFA
jgi:hypothetical protein